MMTPLDPMCLHAAASGPLVLISCFLHSNSVSVKAVPVITPDSRNVD